MTESYIEKSQPTSTLYYAYFEERVSDRKSFIVRNNNRFSYYLLKKAESNSHCPSGNPSITTPAVTPPVPVPPPSVVKKDSKDTTLFVNYLWVPSRNYPATNRDKISNPSSPSLSKSLTDSSVSFIHPLDPKLGLRQTTNRNTTLTSVNHTHQPLSIDEGPVKVLVFPEKGIVSVTDVLNLLKEQPKRLENPSCMSTKKKKKGLT